MQLAELRAAKEDAEITMQYAVMEKLKYMQVGLVKLNLTEVCMLLTVQPLAQELEELRNVDEPFDLAESPSKSKVHSPNERRT